MSTEEVAVREVICEIADKILGRLLYAIGDDAEAIEAAARAIIQRAIDDPDPALRRHLRTIDTEDRWPIANGIIPVVG